MVTQLSRASALTAAFRNRTHEGVRLLLYLACGGLVTVENLLSIFLFSHQRAVPYAIYIIIAQELSILFSFFLNDRVTFDRVTSSKRPWYIRCLRFQSVAVPSGVAIVSIAAALYHFAHFAPLVAQAAAIGATTIANYILHRFWTFRGVPTSRDDAGREQRREIEAAAEIPG